MLEFDICHELYFMIYILLSAFVGLCSEYCCNVWVLDMHCTVFGL